MSTKINFCTEQAVRIEAGFSQSYGKPAFTAIMSAFDQTFANQISNRVLDPNFVVKIDPWGRAFFATMANL